LETREAEAGVEERIDPFETKAIFTLADFVKSLGPNEYYDIAQKTFLRWEQKDESKRTKKIRSKIKLLVRIKTIQNQHARHVAFIKLKQHCVIGRLKTEAQMKKSTVTLPDSLS
jgi:hypothetical protein